MKLIPGHIDILKSPYTVGQNKSFHTLVFQSVTCYGVAKLTGKVIENCLKQFKLKQNEWGEAHITASFILPLRCPWLEKGLPVLAFFLIEALR